MPPEAADGRSARKYARRDLLRGLRVSVVNFRGCCGELADVGMILLALDTTSRPGSAALVRDGGMVEVAVGDAARTHGEQLPGMLIALLARHQLRIEDVGLYAVAAGPGSFTGLRIGIACIQGLALANDRRVVAVSALDAIAIAAAQAHSSFDEPVAVWMDAQRGQVFSRLYGVAIDPPTLLPLTTPQVDGPVDTLRRWQHDCDALGRVRLFAGDGAVRHAQPIRATLGEVMIINPAPLAGVIATIAAARASEAVHPAAVEPIYIRRPDAELARDRAVADPRVPRL